MSREKNLANIDRVLQNVLSKNSKNLAEKNRIPYSENLEKKGSISKYGHGTGLYHVADDPYASLWEQQEIDGKEYLVRTADPKYEQIETSNWTVVSNYDKDNIILSYKKVPITYFASKAYGFNTEDIHMFKQALLEQVNQDDGFIKSVLLEQPESKRLALLSSFPEFKKILGVKHEK